LVVAFDFPIITENRLLSGLIIYIKGPSSREAM
jgi:hypothetical protein